jgi:DNA-directed RNA polymerase specialized sigma24 family protein
MEAAFRELHGRRLHGFALLLTLGDADLAADLVDEALRAAGRRVPELQHPERAAAWLRSWITARADRRDRAGASGTLPASVQALGVDHATLAGMAALDTRTRAAVIGRVVEDLDARDVATIVGRDGRQLARLLERGIARYARFRTAATGGESHDAGPIVARIHDVARRAVT